MKKHMYNTSVPGMHWGVRRAQKGSGPVRKKFKRVRKKLATNANKSVREKQRKLDEKVAARNSRKKELYIKTTNGS